MLNFFPRWAAALTLAAIAPLASAASTVLSFDDLANDFVPANYGGLDWTGSSWFAFDGTDTVYAPHSGSNVVTVGWDGTDATSAVRFNQAATFEGAWFSGYVEGDVTFKLYYQGALVGTSATLLASDTPTFLASGYAGLVDTVSITSSNHAVYAMDDFTFTAAVPEPETYALMLAGLAAITVVARRRRA